MTPLENNNPNRVFRCVFGLYFLAVSFFPVNGQIILTEIMNNPAGNETSIPGGDSNEFIEIYNNGTDSVSLGGWSFDDGDASDNIVPADQVMSPLPSNPNGIYNSTLLPPGHFALILDPEYIDLANDQPYDWPEGTVILSIESTTDLGGSRLATTDPITLYNSAGTPVDSFPDPFDPGEGVSAERISRDPVSDWNNCIAPSGSTPGSRNSLWPHQQDLSIDSLTTEENPVNTTPVSISAHIKNVGQSPIGGTVTLFEDSTFTTLLDSISVPELEPNETVTLNLSVDLDNGSYHLIATVSDDDNTVNNRAFLELLVGPQGWPICISEFMFMPLTNYPEWIELYNRGNEPQSIDGWQFGDAICLHDIPPFTLQPDSFALLCKDTSTFYDTLCDGAILIEPSSWPSLNNDVDEVRLFDNAGLPRHSIAYDASSFGDCMTNGISAEVTEPGGNNLACSPSGSTPGCFNEIWVFQPGGADISASPNPFDPTFEKTLITMSLPSTGIAVRVYDRLGRKIRTICTPENPIGYEFTWDGRNDDGQIIPAGLYILYAEDSGGNSAKTVIAIKGGR